MNLGSCYLLTVEIDPDISCYRVNYIIDHKFTDNTEISGQATKKHSFEFLSCSQRIDCPYFRTSSNRKPEINYSHYRVVS